MLTLILQNKCTFELFATHSMYRNSLDSCLFLVVRLLVHFFISLEKIRTAAYLCCFGLVIVQRVKFLMVTLFKTNNFSLYFGFYRQILLVYNLIYAPAQLLVYLLLSVVFWFGVYLFWSRIETQNIIKIHFNHC